MATKIRFTSAAIAALQLPVEGSEFVYDIDTRWLAVRLYASGERMFYVYRKVAGKPAKVQLGVFDQDIPASREIPRGIDPLELINNQPALNPRMARAIAAAVNVELGRGINPAEVKIQARKKREGELTIDHAFDRYEADHLLPTGKRSTAGLRQMFERYVGSMPDNAKKKHGRTRVKSRHGVDWSRRRLSSVEPGDIRRLMNSLKDGHGAPTANRVFEVLRAMYNKLIEWKLFDGKNPCAEISKFDEHSRERFIVGDELPNFYTALNALTPGPFKDFIELSIYTGARRSNVLGMRWSDVDLHAALWTVPGKLSKNGKAMTLPLTRRAVDVLNRRREAEPAAAFVFPASSKSGYMTPPKKPWAALRTAAGLPDVRLHDLRRTIGSWAAMTGASLPIVGKALGHKSAASTEVYARLQGDPVREAMQRAQDAMAAAGGKPKAQVHPIRAARRRK